MDELTPEEILVQYRLAILDTERAWKEVEEELHDGPVLAIRKARKDYDAAVVSENTWLGRVFEHIHQIDCCSNGPSEED